MVFHFFLKYRTHYGQSIFLNKLEENADGSSLVTSYEMHYHDDSYWHLQIETDRDDSFFSYCYSVRESGQSDLFDGRAKRIIDLSALCSDSVEVFDDWQDVLIEEKVFHSRAFVNVLDKQMMPKFKLIHESGNHVFWLHTQALQPGFSICMLGSGKLLNNWSEKNPVMLSRASGEWYAELDFSKEQLPVEYKFAVYDTVSGKVIKYEDGANRKLEVEARAGNHVILHQFADFHQVACKGAGVNVQLSSLKTERSWGVGDFSDLNRLTDWSKRSGIKMIQLLPINDTTVSRTRKDSYPYSAVSAFAQHPVFLDVTAVADQYNVKLPEELISKAAKLNKNAELDYEAAILLKETAIRMINGQVNDSFLKEKSFKAYFDEHQEWLKPYAVFCALRDRYQTADYSQWDELNIYDARKVKKLTAKGSSLLPEIQLHYFIQYHLHLQLTTAVKHAHQAGIIIKGDLPIGVGRYSVETWMNPELFHMDMQAGAPPDAFATKGQNWSFPTYNWEAMKKDGYLWWRKRLQHMSHYFDATRIDHVLGFFRIWSVPMHAIEGIFGYFVPAIPIVPEDLVKRGMHFDEARLCEPFVSDDLIQSEFGEHAEWIRKNVIVNGHFKETLNTQQKIEAYHQLHPFDNAVKQKLFDWLSNVILLKDETVSGVYHFRIDMQQTSSYQRLSPNEMQILNELYVDYFYKKQNELWYKVAQEKLNAIQQSSDMLICAEDLGMVPDMVEDVLKYREMLALQVQRMPKKDYEKFSLPVNAPYLAVVTPSTHDMSTVRQWWEEDRNVTQDFYHAVLHQSGTAPYYCEPWVAKLILRQHMESNAMWSVFLLQDLLAINSDIRKQDPHTERINIPADPNHYWNYRMHITLEELMKADAWNDELKKMIADSGR